MLTNDEIKCLILLSKNFEEVDKILNSTCCKTIEDKLNLLKDLFNVEVIFDGDGGEDDYRAVVNAILRW